MPAQNTLILLHTEANDWFILDIAVGINISIYQKQLQFQPKSKGKNGFQSQRSVITVQTEVQDDLFGDDIFGDSSDLETFGQGSRVDGGNDTEDEEERGLIIGKSKF